MKENKIKKKKKKKRNIWYNIWNLKERAVSMQQ